MGIDLNCFEPINVRIAKVKLNGVPAIKVVKSKKMMNFDENTYAKLKNNIFHNGIIEIKLLSRLLYDAPEFSRGFIGVAFRINSSDSEFESFYIRPTNGRSADLTRRNRSFQYFSYPRFKFNYFREKGITDYEGTCDVGLDQWIDLKLIIQDTKAEFYINKKLILTVKDLKLGDSKGSLGLFVDIGTEGYFKDLKVTFFD